MRFGCALLAVQDVEVSKRFYGTFFDEKVVMDYGLNVTFSGGFAIQQAFGWLTGLPEESVQQRSHNMELYYECDDLDAFLQKLDAHPEVERVHGVKTHDWKQRAIRIYDPDGHIIEIGEAIPVVVRRWVAEGYTLEDVQKEFHLPMEALEAFARGEG